MCQMSNIWHIWHTKHKKRALSDVLNLKNYATLLQYRLKYETVWTKIAKSNIIILLRFSLSSSTDISLSLSTLSHFFSLSITLYLFPLLPAQESCSRSLSSPHRWSRQSLPLILLPHSPQLATSCSNPCHRHPQPSPPTFKSLLIRLWVWDLRWVSMSVLGRRFGSALCGLWV